MPMRLNLIPIPWTARYKNAAEDEKNALFWELVAERKTKGALYDHSTKENYIEDSAYIQRFYDEIVPDELSAYYAPLVKEREDQRQHATNPWLDYWRAALVLSDLDKLYVKEHIRSRWHGTSSVDWTVLDSGRIPVPVPGAAVKDREWNKLLDLGYVRGSSRLNVLILIGREFPDWKQPGQKRGDVILAVPAQLNPEAGTLHPFPDGSLLINSKNLANDSREARKPVLGELEEHAITKRTVDVDEGGEHSSTDTIDPNEEATEQTWPEYWQNIQSEFETLLAQSPRHYLTRNGPNSEAGAFARFRWTHGRHENRLSFMGIAPYQAEPGANSNLLKLIQSIQSSIADGNALPSLLARFIDGVKAQHYKSVAWSDEQLALHCRQNHQGHMGSDFGLDRTQRIALWQTRINLPEALLIAVSGPPGTGKTSMLQGVIGSIIVDAALRGAPSLIIAASQTNQATTNMITAFAGIAPKRSANNDISEQHRWIDGVPSYGWFSPSADKASDYPAYQLLLSRPREPGFDTGGIAAGFGDPLEADADRAKYLRAEFMRCYKAWATTNSSGSASDVDKAASHLQKVIFSLVGHGTDAAKQSLLQKEIINHQRLMHLLRAFPQSEIRAARQRLARTNRRVYSLPSIPSEWETDVRKLDSTREALLKTLVDLDASPAPKGLWSKLKYHFRRFGTRNRRCAAADSLVRMRSSLMPACAPLAPEDVPSLARWAQDAHEELKSSAKRLRQQIDRCVARREWVQNRLKQRDRARKSLDKRIAPILAAEREIRELRAQMPALVGKHRGPEAQRKFEEGLSLPSLPSQAHPLTALAFRIRRVCDAGVSTDQQAWELAHELECVLDLTLRFRAFHLSMRYWEARWLLEITNPLPENDREKVVASLTRSAMLAPVIVATVQSMPRLVAYTDYSTGELMHTLGAADWLILDEAGQVPPQLAAPLLALSGKALVVGDVMQLKPVVDMDARNNRDLRRIAGIGLGENDHERHALDAKGGSVMAAAQFAASLHEDYGTRYGVMLQYHYRCRKTIIEFCNRLVYDQLDPLIPMIPDVPWNSLQVDLPDRGKALLPAMGFVAVPNGEQKPGSEGSQTNYGELEEIVRFVNAYRTRIERFYTNEKNKPQRLEDVMAIVTPYGAQVGILKERFKAMGFQVESVPNGGPDALQPMVIGTVHSLQGAEKPIVLFSGVSSDPAKKPFMDNDTDMLNVAVSRAKDSFIMFGHPAILFQRANSQAPSALLGKYLLEHGHRLYPRQLAIIEGSGKIDAVESALGLTVRACATGGHFREIDLSTCPPVWRMRPGTDGAKAAGDILLDRIRDFIVFGSNHYDHVWLATDDDTEGEAIAWHVLDTLREEKISIPRSAIKRLRLSSMDPDAIRAARAQATDGVDVGRVRAALTRAVADAALREQFRVVCGIKMGRVSAAMLDLVDKLNRERAQPRWRETFAVHDSQGVEHTFVRLARNAPLAPAMDHDIAPQSPTTLWEPPAQVDIETTGTQLWIEPSAPATDTAAMMIEAARRHVWMPQYTLDAMEEAYLGKALDTASEAETEEAP